MRLRHAPTFTKVAFAKAIAMKTLSLEHAYVPARCGPCRQRSAIIGKGSPRIDTLSLEAIPAVAIDTDQIAGFLGRSLPQGPPNNVVSSYSALSEVFR